MKFYFLTILLNCIYLTISAQSWIPLNGPNGAEINKSIMTSEGRIYSITRSNEVYISKDKGINWEKIKIPPFNVSTCLSVLIAESPTNDIFININCTLYKVKYLDNSVELVKGNMELNKIYFTSSGVIFAVNFDKLFISNDGGQTFTQKLFSGNILSIKPIEKDLNLIQVNSNFLNKEIWTMKDDGSLISTKVSSITDFTIFHHRKSNKIYAFNTASFVSEDKGQSWILFNPIVTGGRLYQAWELNDGSILAAGVDHYYRSIDNGLTWSIDSSYFSANVRPYNGEHFINNNNELYIDTYYDKILAERNGKTNLIKVNVNRPDIGQIYQKNQSEIFAITSRELQYSNDDGRSWRTIYDNLKLYGELLFFKDGSLLLSEDNQLLLSEDLGSNWNQVILPSIVKQIDPGHVLTNSKDEILILDPRSDAVFFSSDKGRSWTSKPSSNIPYSPSGFQISENDIVNAYSTHDGQFYYSMDFGINWMNSRISFDQILNPVLTNNSQLITFELGNFDTSYLLYTNDFGITFDTINVSREYFLYANDRFGNCYLINDFDMENSAILNIYTKRLIPADLSQIILSDFWKLHAGENGYLYAYTGYNILYKYHQKINTYLSQVSGNIILDENQNCKKDGNENQGFPYQISIKNQNNLTYNIPVNKSGDFKAFVSAGNYQLQLPNSNTLWQECNLPKNIQINGKDSVKYNDLLIKPIQWCSEVRVQSTLGRLRRCFDNNIAYIYIKNYGSKNAKDVKVKLILDDYFDNIISSVNPYSQQGNILEYIIPELKLSEELRIQLNFRINCSASLNQEHCIKAMFENPDQCNQNLPNPDTTISCEKNIGSFDPNDKMAYTNGMPLTNKITSDQDIEYLIRFQNTGTDTAFKVVIRDQLDKNLDWNSFEVLSSSHPYSFTMDDGGLVTFLFKDILLPDSSINVVASNGYIKYSIKQKDNIALGTVIHNEAAIYFDYNEPVWTNNVSLQLVSPSKTKNYSQDILLTIMPNPFSTRASISLPKELEDQEKLIKIFDLHGKEIMQYRSMEKSIELVNDHFTNGVYLIKVFAKNGKTGIAKFVVEK